MENDVTKVRFAEICICKLKSKNGNYLSTCNRWLFTNILFCQFIHSDQMVWNTEQPKGRIHCVGTLY